MTVINSNRMKQRTSSSKEQLPFERSGLVNTKLVGGRDLTRTIISH
jgi:hypothetical protein